MSFDIVGFGVATLDIICQVDDFPVSGGKEQILSRQYHGGGLTATALVAAAKLGASCWYGGPIGSNDISDRVRRLLNQYGVALAPPGTYPDEVEPIVSHVFVEKSTGERTILWANFAMVPPVFNEEAKRLVLAAKALFADCHYAKELLPIYRLARQHGIPIVGDFEWLKNSDDEEAFALIDHPVLPFRFAAQWTETDDAETIINRLFERHSITAAVITNGNQGCWFAERDDRTVRHQPAFKVDVCDTTGCGDVFHGAYAAGLVQGCSLAERVRRATAAAALKATRPGGQAAAPTRDEVELFLK